MATYKGPIDWVGIDWVLHEGLNFFAYSTSTVQQRAKKVLSDSPGLVDFAIGLLNSVFNLSDG